MATAWAQYDETGPVDAASRSKPAPLDRVQQPKNVVVEYELSEDGEGYYVYERVGGRNIRPPSYISRDEYIEMREKERKQQFFRNKTRSGESTVEAPAGNSLVPKLNVNNKLFETVFGSNKVDIKPNVSVLLDFAVRRNVMKNPALTQRQQRNTMFNFQQQIQMDVVGSIGEKLKLRVNYDTEAMFAFQNQFKINYVGNEDDMIKSIEAGNVSLPINGSLITGGQNLFGIKVGLQLGPVLLTMIGSQQRGKTQEINVSGGSQQTFIERKIGEYDENRHFFLSHAFRNQYERALANLPIVSSPIFINRVEVWVTNRAGIMQQGNRNAVGYIDLGENDTSRGGLIHNRMVIRSNQRFRYPENNANNLSAAIIQNAAARSKNTATAAMQELGLRNGEDFELFENLRKLNPNDYTINKQLGYISLSQRLNPNDVLFVAYEYTVNGETRVYRVGEFDNDIPADQTNSNVLHVKMLKPSRVNTGPSPLLPNAERFPTWDLMMKNVYSIGSGNLNPDGFTLDVVYESTDGDGDINYLPTSNLANTPLIQVFNIDRLTNNSERGPDNKFDFIPGVTVVPDRGLIVLPVLEPFGDFLVRRFKEDGNYLEDSARYAYPMLYRFTMADAVNFYPRYNRFKFRGQFQGRSSTEIFLNSIQIAPGSVRVTAGGTMLREGSDYAVDYSVGKVTILNPGILSSGQQVKVSFETNSLMGIDQKTMVGARVDYRFSKEITFGGTLLHLNERPLIQKVMIGDEPIANTIWGVDMGLRKESRFLTKLVDKLPFYQTSAPSEITFNGEFAHLIPGVSRRIRPTSEKGIAYIDDFEGTRVPTDLMGQTLSGWRLSSIPQNPRILQALDPYRRDTSLRRYLGYTRAKLAWYMIDPIFYDQPQQFGYDNGNPQSDVNKQYTRRVAPQEIFPNRTVVPGTNLLTTFDLVYQPQVRGQYNFQTDRAKLNPEGTFINPTENWAGIMRRTTTNTDFEAINVEFIEFWMMDPFIENTTHPGLDLFLNLGRVSEDVIPDGERSFENGLPINSNDNSNNTNLRQTPWGRVPLAQTPTIAFDNNPAAREFQDVGLDGLRSEDEVSYNLFRQYLADLRGYLNQDAMAIIERDPSSDDFQFFRDYPNGSGLIQRYERFNGLEGNSPIPVAGQPFAAMGSTTPDVEDLNADATLNTTESYYEYKMRIQPNELQIGRNYIVDKREGPVRLPSDPEGQQNGLARWYLFRIPVMSERREAIGGIRDLKAVDFVRMYMTNSPQPCTLRFGKIELVATNWRRFIDRPGFIVDGDTTGQGTDPANPDPNNADFQIGTLSVEENGQKLPFNYMAPPNIERQQVVAAVQPNVLQNEQALVMKTNNLQPGREKGVFRMVNYDLRNYRYFKMWVHAEDIPNSVCGNSDDNIQPVMFVRIGTDLTNNYYEYEFDVRRSEGAENNREVVWANDIMLEISKLQEVKSIRNQSTRNYDQVYVSDQYPNIKIRGNPRLDNVKNVMVGIRNPEDAQRNPDKKPLCLEVWLNEIRVTHFDNQSSWAANARVNVKLADLANVSLSASRMTPRFGSLEKRINERSQEDIQSYDLAMNINAGKLLPPKVGIDIPFFFTFGERIVTPRFDPVDPDILLETSAESRGTESDRERKLAQSIDYTRTWSYSFTNVRKLRTNQQKKPKIYDLENFVVSYGYNERFRRNAQIEYHLIQNFNGSIGYGYTFQPKNLKPFGKIKSPFLKLLADLNITPLPRQFTVRIDGLRSFEEQQLRTIANPNSRIPSTFNKNFVMNRSYTFQWDLTQSLRITYSAMNQSRIDEPIGRNTIDTLGNTVRSNFLNLNEQSRTSPQSLQRMRFNWLNMGRTINFRQNINMTYQLPLKNIKPLNWVNATVNYTADFSWESAQVQNFSFGNVISNRRNINSNLQLNMAQLYKKFPIIDKWLKPIPRKTIISKTDTSRKKKDEPSVFLRRVGKTVAGWVFSIQTIDVTYAINQGSVLPGYMARTDNFGMDFNYPYFDSTMNQRVQRTEMAPGVGYILGDQPLQRNPNGWFREHQHWFSINPAQTRPFTTMDGRDLQVRTAVTLFKGFRVELNAQRSLNKNMEGTFIFDEERRDHSYAMRSETGTFNMTFLSIGTAFGGTAGSNRAFQAFDESRRQISQRLFEQNSGYVDLMRGEGAYAGRILSEQNGGRNSFQNYYNGYLGSSQNVLLPAFMSAYGPYRSDRAPTTTFPMIPLPNWNVNYTGLSQLDLFKNLFKSVTLRHGYRSTYNFSFNRTLAIVNNEARLFDRQPASNITDQSAFYEIQTPDGVARVPVDAKDILPQYTIQSVSISEQFTPLIGVNIAWKNGINTTFDYKQMRTLALNVGAMQLNENRTNDISAQFSWRKDRALSPISLLGRSFELKNTITFRMDLTLRNIRTENRYLDATRPPEPTGGNQNIIIKPSADYMVNSQLTVQVYVEHTRNNPVVSTSFPTRFTAFGIRVQFRLN
jgi:cell surface protein SprA